MKCLLNRTAKATLNQSFGQFTSVLERVHLFSIRHPMTGLPFVYYSETEKKRALQPAGVEHEAYYSVGEFNVKKIYFFWGRISQKLLGHDQSARHASIIFSLFEIAFLLSKLCALIHELNFADAQYSNWSFG